MYTVRRVPPPPISLFVLFYLFLYILSELYCAYACIILNYYFYK